MRVLWLVVCLASLVGCASSAAPDSSAAVSSGKQTAQDFRQYEELTPVVVEPDVNLARKGSWGVLGDIEISPYSAGYKIDQEHPGYVPYWIINRISDVTERKRVTTDPGETKAGIPIHRDLYLGDTSRTAVASSISERLSVVGYDAAAKLLVIDGFLPAATRTLTITYVPETVFYVQITQDKSPRDGYAAAPPEVVDWAVLSASQVRLGPDAYAPVWVTLEVPKAAKNLPKKWQFWLTTGVAAPSNVGVITTTLDGGPPRVKVDGSVGGVLSEIIVSNPYRVVMR